MTPMIKQSIYKAINKPKIIQYPSKTLHKVSQAIETIDDDVRALADFMAGLVVKEGAAGLAAIQVGVPLRMFIGYNENEKQVVMVNPVLHRVGVVKPPQVATDTQTGEPVGGGAGVGAWAPWADKAAVQALDNDRQVMVEGCLSLRGVTAPTARYPVVEVEWQDLTAATHRVILTSSLAAQCFQHELEHLDGKFFTDVV